MEETSCHNSAFSLGVDECIEDEEEWDAHSECESRKCLQLSLKKNSKQPCTGRDKWRFSELATECVLQIGYRIRTRTRKQKITGC